MVAAKRKRTDLSVPDWITAEFNKGSKQKADMAEILLQVNGNKDHHHNISYRISTIGYHGYSTRRSSHSYPFDGPGYLCIFWCLM